MAWYFAPGWWVAAGIPRAALDMVFVFPHLARTDGREIGATTARQRIGGHEFQRWSRHYTPENPWVVGVDGVERHVLSIEDWFRREFVK